MPRKEREMWSIKKSGCDHAQYPSFMWPVMWSMSFTHYAKKGEGHVAVTTTHLPALTWDGEECGTSLVHHSQTRTLWRWAGSRHFCSFFGKGMQCRHWSLEVWCIFNIQCTMSCKLCTTYLDMNTTQTWQSCWVVTTSAWHVDYMMYNMLGGADCSHSHAHVEKVYCLQVVVLMVVVGIEGVWVVVI